MSGVLLKYTSAIPLTLAVCVRKNVPGSCKWCSPPSPAAELNGIQPCSHTPGPQGGDCTEMHAERRSEGTKITFQFSVVSL